MKAISKHKLQLALSHPDVPLSDHVHGVYKMLSPDVLHVISEGISKYVFESLGKTISNTMKAGQAAIASIQRVFLKIHKSVARNSERDLPRGSTNSGLSKSTKIWAYQRTGNLVRLLCL